MSNWEPGDVAALLTNPFYAIEIHKSFSRSHGHVLTEARWIASNERAAREVGAAQWLEKLMSALQADHSRGRFERSSLAMADPYQAVTVDPTLCLEHPPIVNVDLWVRANATGLEEHSVTWLRNLLFVLKGVYPGSDSPSGEGQGS